MSINAGDVLKIVIAYNMPEGVIAQLVANYIMTIGDPQDEANVLDGIVANMETAWAHIEDHIVDGVTGDTAKLSVYDTGLDQWDEKASVGVENMDGVGIGEMLPHGMAAVIRFFTGVGRRQGRKFIMGLSEASQEDSVLDVAVLAALALFAIDWDDVVDVGGASFKPCVYNEATEDHEGFLQTFAINTIMGYQRRRKPGVGI